VSIEVKVAQGKFRSFLISKSDAVAEIISSLPEGAIVYGYDADVHGPHTSVEVIYGVETKAILVDAPKVVQHPWTDRLARIERRTPIELRASDLAWAIEKMGAHPLLTEAQSLVDRALRTLGAWTDAGEPGRSDLCYESTPGDDVHEHLVHKTYPGTPIAIRAETLAGLISEAYGEGKHSWKTATPEEFKEMISVFREELR